MTSVARWMTGLQAYAYDVNEEGATEVVRGAQMAAANVIHLAMSYCSRITTRDPERAPRLPHNPWRDRHAEEAFVRPGEARYPTALVPPVSTDAALDGVAAYMALRAEADRQGITTVPWILGLSQRAALHASDYAVVNARGDTVPGWLCPSRSETRDFVAALIDDIVRMCAPSAIFLDAVRFPEPRPGRLVDGLACFCAGCGELASSRGIDLDRVRQALLAVIGELEARPADAAARMSRRFGSGFQTIRAALAARPILDWLALRQAAIDGVIATARDATDGRCELWLDVWPPTYGWLLGQDLTHIGRCATWIRPFTYHRWGGGADIPGLIGSMSPEPDVQQALYEAFLSFFRFPGPARYVDFLAGGLSPQFITDETLFLKELLAGRSRAAAGLQVWQMGRSGVHEALEHALAACPDGVILHCYGWAEWEELQAAGDWLRERGLGSDGQTVAPP